MGTMITKLSGRPSRALTWWADMHATNYAAAASNATRARRSPGGRSNTPATATCTGVRVAPGWGGRRELAATREPRYAPTAASWPGCIMAARVPCDTGRSDTTSSAAGGGGAVWCTGRGAAAITASALSHQPALATRQQSRSGCALISLCLIRPARHLATLGG